MFSGPISIAFRLTIASSLALVAFLGVAAWALDRAFERSAVEAIQLRLLGYFYSLVQESDVNVKGKLLLPELLPDPKLERVGSGLYAGIRGDKFSWLSPSAKLGRELPFDADLEPGSFSFGGPVKTSFGNVYIYSRGVSFGDRGEYRFTYFIGEHENSLIRQKQAFRETMLGYLGGLGLGLLVIQGLLLRWSLNPLRYVAKELADVERGNSEQLKGPYPSELEGLTSNLNRVISTERDNLKRYRNTLGDLAHSLKTPLAVMRGLLDAGPDRESLVQGTEEQIHRMNEIVAYQLARAAAGGHKTFAVPLPLEKHAEEIVRSLEKVYAAKAVLCEFELDPHARFHGELGDLMEVLGNLLDNAFKWAGHRVVLTTRCVAGNKARRPGLEICVEDDGPGIPPERIADMLKRGVRGDERVQGHGIGLSTVSNVVDSYQGQLHVDASPELGGARFSAIFPPI